MTFTDSIRTCYKKSFSIKGCASRSEYWWFWLYQMLMYIVIALLGAALTSGDGDSASAVVAIAIIFVLINFPANFCVTIRRLHDQDLSGWTMFLVLIPYIGSLILFIIMMTGSDPNSRFRPEEERIVEDMPTL